MPPLGNPSPKGLPYRGVRGDFSLLGWEGGAGGGCPGAPPAKRYIACRLRHAILKPAFGGRVQRGSQIIRLAQWLASTALIWETHASAKGG